MSWRITYRDKWSGKTVEHVNKNSVADAKGWAESLARDNNCKATCVEVADGPYDYSGTVTHVITVGDDGKS